jgi:TrmH family RNA methyltransferase
MGYPKITSSSNERIRNVLKMERQASDSKRLLLIEGPHLIEMAMNSGAEIVEVFVAEKFISETDSSGLMARLDHVSAEIFEVSDHIIKKLSGTETTQGVVALAELRMQTLEALNLQEKPLLIVADGIQDPGNLGSIIRTADAAGADAVIIMPGTCDAYSQKVIRSTAGSLFNISVINETPDRLLKWLEDKGMALTVTAADAELSVFEADLIGPVAMAFGNEGRGISRRLKKAAAVSIRIPILGRAESLNVAASAAVCIYEAARQRGGRGEQPGPATEVPCSP